jgi:cytochrome bd ubiquinol oxidase subunit II
LPFVLTVAFFIAALLTLALLFWPYMIPYTITIGNAAAPDKTLSFFFWGAGAFILPVIVIYTAGVYWVFRGKFLKDKVSGYGSNSSSDVEHAKREAGPTAA